MYNCWKLLKVVTYNCLVRRVAKFCSVVSLRPQHMLSHSKLLITFDSPVDYILHLSSGSF